MTTTTPVDFDKVFETQETFQAYLEGGGDPNAQDEDGLTMLWLASPEQAELLIRSGAIVDHQDSGGNTALFETGADIKKVLLKAGANPNHRNHKGETPLFCALGVEEAAVLLDGRADTNAVDNDGNTALGAIINLSFAEINRVEELKILVEYVETLIKHGANPCVAVYQRGVPGQGLLEEWLYTISGQDLNKIPDDEDWLEVNNLRAKLTRILVRAEDAWRAAHPETGP
jgi:ankyrin repeat protein